MKESTSVPSSNNQSR